MQIQKNDQINHDLRDVLKPYANQWVALSRDRTKVVSAGMTLKEVIRKIKGNDFLLMKVFPSDAFYLPLSS
ncbi:MAG: hypothetical protein HZB10_03035 [Candidatus Yonathbacteria bacterium]|nr:hypothetical protein [Candidatus Yonathbacteria bacterium]